VIGRRKFIAFAGIAAAVDWPLGGRAQTVPVIGYLSSRSAASDVPMVKAFRQGLSESGYVEGRNVAIEFRWADGQYERLPALAEELVRRQVAVIVTGGSELPAQAAKAATAKIPIVFTMGNDPVRAGLVESINHPGGNITGVSSELTVLGTKNLNLLRELAPNAGLFAVIVNPNDATAQAKINDLQSSARSLGIEIMMLYASTEAEIETAFTSLVARRPGALLVTPGPFFLTRARQFALLAERYSIPAMYSRREYVEAGGLMSYGSSTAEYYRQLGIYAGKILGGVKPSDLPVVIPTKFELVINLKVANALGLTIPASLLATADEVIE
jgi:putative tryptophan/tyrosine transport system substrate-binding protein